MTATATSPSSTLPANAAERAAAVPLCVDLDGTLLRGDLLHESLFDLLRRSPWAVVKLFGTWRREGLAALKAQLVEQTDVERLRFVLNDEVLEHVRRERQHRSTVLVTGSHQRLGEAVAARTDAFDRVQGSDTGCNLTAERKRDWLVAQFGAKGFDYIGNHADDRVVWQSARRALCVSSAGGIEQTPGQDFERVFRVPSPKVRDWLSLLRVHQWVKNGLVAVPFLLDHREDTLHDFAAMSIAFFAMSLLASATYVLNDLLDVQADRGNQTKARRVLASGRIGVPQALMVMAACAAGACALTLLLPAPFAIGLLGYLLVTLAYSFGLKRVAILDTVTLAGLHTLRVIVGTLAIGSTFSFWLLAFSMFFFFSLANAKRVAELQNLSSAGRANSEGRDYRVTDLPMLAMTGVSTGYVSVLVVALYINSDKSVQNYATPAWLWSLCPLLAYWLGRIWLKTWRSQMHEDPIVYALRDRESRVVALLIVAAVLLAIL